MPTGGDAKSVTQQGDYYIMKIKYINAGSAMITIPFKATLKANGLVNGETYNIPIEFYKADGTLLATTHNNFVAFTLSVLKMQYSIQTQEAIYRDHQICNQIQCCQMIQRHISEWIHTELNGLRRELLLAVI